MSSPEITPVDNMPSTDALTARVPLHLGGNRLDKVIAELFPQYSRSRLQTWMKQGRVLVNDQPVQKSNQKVQGQDTIALSPGVLEHMQTLIPEDLHLDIVGQSEDYTVVNKQAGLVVHPAPGHWTGTLMNGLYFLDPGLISVPRAGIVHRLDADTTGLMVVARTSETQVKLVQMLQSRIVKRVYLALVWGRISQPVTVNKPLGRDPRNRLRMAVVDHGKPAVTHFMPVAHGELLEVPVTLMVCRLETGRTHQIRVHAQHAGFALVADPVYKIRGAGNHSTLRMSEIPLPDGTTFKRQALHATHLSFPDPAEFEAREPGTPVEDWEEALDAHEWPEFVAKAPADLKALGDMAGIDFHSDAVHLAILEQAHQHKASVLVRFDHELDAGDDEEEDGDYDVEVVEEV
ncbi:RluA family pseudouridine synthase [Limnobacter humi]|uniref:Ribosomal large subunit pseudouridine synthase D n=1 Tax=Limnobacter humi TaxID=1778671 RepID=A0ABT1WFE0_9BURK|nr:RluA family pseudouridine synthase [Limnobacter humi]MCQ8896233.1 RluA family pseudouridine synthase [Limnobacter humi]